MLIPLKLVRDRPLQQQLYDQLCDLIVSGRLAPGTRMPSTRMLAEQFAISRITVLLTYERLIAEGHLETLPAKGTFVARPASAPVPPRLPRPSLRRDPPPRIGRPDPSEFPTQRWRALIRGALDHLGANLGTDYTDGHPGLRRAIARWLSTSRGLAVSPDQVILAACRQQALYLAAHLLLRPGSHAIVEEPSDAGIEGILASAGATVAGAPVDGDGMLVDLLPERNAALVHVTPEHQRPLGVTLSLARRQRLLCWAIEQGATILEEDCDGELRYGPMDAPPLMSMDRDERVVHVGCFAVALGPGVTPGYLVVPPRLVASALALRRLVADRAGWMEEAALAEFLDSGAYARHLHRVRKIYLARRDTMIEALRRHFGKSPRLSGLDAGLHLAWTLPPRLGSALTVADCARRHGLDAAAVARTPSRPGHETVLLGFGMPNERQIALAMEHLAVSVATRDLEALSGD